jgi:GNAT superfamily N-acetyltransferase
MEKAQPSLNELTELRPMYMSDLPKVVKIIDFYDDDDAEAAEADFHNNGFEGHFVLELDGKVIGVTGYRNIAATDRSCWLSWTYLANDQRGKGLGKFMTQELLQKVKQIQGRKIFVKISDYDDPDEGKIYAPALAMYQSLGFVEEVKSVDFYDEGEDQMILGLNLSDAAEDETNHMVEEEKPIIRFNGLHKIAETKAAYTFLWEVRKKKKLFGKRNFTVEDLLVGLNAVKKAGGKKIFLTFPSNLPLIHAPLQGAGFKFVGQLSDYYEKGVHESHFSHDLSNI